MVLLKVSNFLALLSYSHCMRHIQLFHLQKHVHSDPMNATLFDSGSLPMKVSEATQDETILVWGSLFYITGCRFPVTLDYSSAI